MEFHPVRLPDGTTRTTLGPFNQVGGNTFLTQGRFQSPNYKKGEAGWMIDTSGLAEFTNLIVTGSSTLGGWTINATSIYTGTEDHAAYTGAAGDMTFYSDGSDASIHAFNFYIGTDGTYHARLGDITGVSIAGIPNDTATDIALLTYTHTLVFSSTDNDTVAWASGTITMSNGRTFSITGANTGNMVALTWIYLDTAVSSTLLQTTTTAATAMGANKIPLAIAQNNADSGANATFVVQGGTAGVAITAPSVKTAALASITADLGAVTAGSFVLPSGGFIRSGQTAFDTGTGFYIANDSGTPKFSFGNSAGNKITWDGTTLTIVGVTSDVQTFTSSGTWTKPAFGTRAFVQLWGGGGSGGMGNSDNTGGGGGGGGGVYAEGWYLLSDLGSTETVTLGDGGAAKATVGNGNAGGDSTFGSHLTAYGGGRGGGAASLNGGGGGGAGSLGAGGNATTSTPGIAGRLGGGVGATTSLAADPTTNSGGAGGINEGATGQTGGKAFWGGGGGGAQAGGVALSGGTSVNGGAGGAGSPAGAGVAGSQPSGGGGGAGNNTGATGPSGAGGKGKCVITVA